MTSKIVVNNIESDSGISSITFNSNITGKDSTQNISGINSVTATTYYGDGSQLTGISVDTTKIETSNTKVETIDTSSDSHVKVTIDGSERLRINTLGVTTITSSANEELFRIQTSFGNGGGVQGKALMGFDHFSVSQKPAILIGSEEDGNASHKGSFVIKLKDAAATDDDPVERFRISSEGYITNSARPCFDVAKDDGAVSSTNAIVFNVVNVNNGSHYDTSNGRFTAPVTGTYFLYFGGIKNNSSSTVRLKLLKNGTGNYMNADREIRYDTGGNYGENASMNVIASLTASDYVQVYVTQGTIYGTDASYTHFGGYLLS
tara:strand:- start:2091 stop:3047 length:957 start_codon:yes stop_codon:yes gene_type:complete